MKSAKAKDSLTICGKTKKKALHADKKMKTKNQPLVEHGSLKSQELWEVHALPSDWKSVPKPSKVIEKIMKKRQEEHDETLIVMRNAMANINTEVEDYIRVASEIYKKEFKQSKTEIKNCLQNIREILKGPATLATENFTKAVDDVSLIYRANKFHLTTLLRKLRELERFRTAKFKDLLRDAYSKLNKVSYKLPFEIQELFEQEIQAINETTLTNIRGYNELKLNLRLQLKNEIRLCFEEIQYLKEKWYYYIKYTLFTNLNRDKLFGRDWNQEALETSVPESEDCSPYTDWTADGSTINVNKMFQWVNRIEHVMNHVDVCAQKIVGSFKEAIIKVVAGYFEDMRKAIQTILDQGIIEKWEVKAVQAEFCGQAVVDVTEKYTEELTKLQDLWTESKRELELCLEDALLFLKHFSDIWSTHFQRVNQIKNLVTQDLKRVMTEGFLLVCEEETKINIKIDMLRQECEGKDLDQEWDNVLKCLDNLKVVYVQNQQEESAVVENITDFLRMEAELLQSELMYFLNTQYETANTILGNIAIECLAQESLRPVDDEESVTFRSEPTTTLLANEIRMCKEQIQLLGQWKFGFHNIIAKYAHKCPEESAELAKEWITAEKNKSILRLKMIEVLLAARYYRLKSHISSIRKAELLQNRKRLREHEEGTDQEISNLASIFENYEKRYNQVLEQCNVDIERIKNRAINANNSAVVTSEMTYFETLMATNTNKIVAINQEYQTDINRHICEIFKCNFNYIKAIRLFSEGGNGTVTLSTNICNNFSKLEKRYKKKITLMTQNNDKACSKCLQVLGDAKFKVNDFLSKYQGELKHYDDYTYALKDIQVEIKKEVYHIKFKGKQLSSALENLWQVGTHSIGESEKIELFIKHAERFMQVIEECESILKRPISMIELRIPSKTMVNKNMSGTTVSLPAKIGRMQSKIKASMSFTDYSSYLFDVPPVNEECFISKIQYLLFTSYKNIQSEAKDFYQTHPPDEIINADKIHDSYQNFVSNTLPKYIYYYLQCELVWLEEAHVFLTNVNEILPNIRKLRIKSLQKYVDINDNKLGEAYNTAIDELTVIKLESKEQFLTLHKKLMPLHGHPKNITKLEELDKEVQHFLQEKSDGYVEPVNEYRKDFNERELEFTVGLFKINDSMKALENMFEKNTYLSRTLSELLDTLLRMKNFVMVPQDFDTDDSVLLDAAKKLEFYKRNIIIPPEYLLSLNPSSLLCNTPREDCSTDSVDIPDDINVIQKVEDYRRKKEEIIEKIESIVETNKCDIDTWKIMWKKAIENVIGLYKVKYDPAGDH